MNPDRGEHGFALVWALWAAVAMGLIAASVMTLGRGDARISRIRATAAQGSALADAGLTAAIYRLLARDPAFHPPLDGTPFAIDIDGRSVTLRVQDESGKVDINTAPDALLLRLIVSAGVDFEVARALTDRILDWREPGTLKRLNGAKQEDYRLSGYPYGPRGGPFLSTEELRLVMGMTPDLYERLRPAITVVSQLGTIDPAMAPKQALMALAGMDSETADRLVASRHPSDQAAAVTPLLTDLIGHAFTLQAELAGEGRTASRKATIRLSGDPRNPLWVYDWQ
jgi:general secretion pathway protein K